MMKNFKINFLNKPYEREGLSPLTLQSSVLVVTTRRNFKAKVMTTSTEPSKTLSIKKKFFKNINFKS